MAVQPRYFSKYIRCCLHPLNLRDECNGRSETDESFIKKRHSSARFSAVPCSVAQGLYDVTPDGPPSGRSYPFLEQLVSRVNYTREIIKLLYELFS